MKQRALFLVALLCVTVLPLAADPPAMMPRRPADRAGARLAPGTPLESIVIKFHEGTRIRLRGNALAALARNPRENARLAELGLTGAQVENDLHAARSLLASSKVLEVPERLFTASENALAERRASGETRSGRELADLDLYYRVRVRPGTTQAGVDLLLESLNALASIEIAYAQPPPSVAVDIPPTTPNFQPYQGYLNAAPQGIDALYAWTVPGGRGAGTAIVDVEGAWRTTHEDLPSLFHQGGTQYNDLGWRNHGTAVLGVLAAPSNGYGMTGIVHQAVVGYESIGSQSTASAIMNAASAAGLSGLVLIELHAPGPSTANSSCNCSGSQCDFVPMEYFQAEYDAIASATASGTIVVEAGGNGATDLDDPVYGGRFNRWVRDSGAILVGASESATRSPTCFTNFGTRIDMHGWGWNVATLGYGDLFNPNNDENQRYTSGFSGTSSASPIVTGAASSIVGVSLADSQGYGYRSPEEIRRILADTGTPEACCDSRNIGPLPDLRAAIPRVLDRRPIAFITIDCVGLVCSVDAGDSWDDHGIVQYEWDWGDNSTSSGGPLNSHTYAANGTYTVTLTVTDMLGQTGFDSEVVPLDPPTTPGSFAATANSATSVTLTWTASTSGSGIARYVIQRRGSHTGAWGPEQTTTATALTDFGVTAGFMYQYRVKAVNNASQSSAFAFDYATTVVFGPDLQRFVTAIGGGHIRDLRDAVDAWRGFAGLAGVYPVNPLPTGKIAAAHFITNLAADPLPGVVSALNQARNAMGLVSFNYTGVPAPAPGVHAYLEHVQQLRGVMK